MIIGYTFFFKDLIPPTCLLKEKKNIKECTKLNIRNFKYLYKHITVDEIQLKKKIIQPPQFSSKKWIQH